jgi:hypothetical protein
MTFLKVPSDFGSVVTLSASQIAAPTAYQLKQTHTTYVLDSPPYTRYWSDGSSLVSNLSLLYGLVPSSQTAAINNTALIQTALNRGGDVNIIVPGVYYINSVLTVPSNTTVYIGSGVTIKVTVGSPSAVFTNSAARSIGIAVSAANASYTNAPDGQNYCAVITSMAAVDAARFPVNSWVSAVVLGHGALGVKGTAWEGIGYRGVWRVVEQTINGASSSIKYLIPNFYPGSAPSSNNLTLYPADENIKVWGPGIIDGNGSLADQSYNTGNPQGNLIWLRHCYNVTVEGLSFKRGVTWTIGSNYVRNYTVRGISGELRIPANFASVDLVHLSGNHQNVLIEDIDGGSADNAVGMTMDCPSQSKGTAPNFLYQDPGDMYDITIRRVSADAICEDGSFGIVALYGPEAYIYRNIVIDGVSGMGSSAVQLSNYSTTQQNKLTIDRIEIKNVRAMVGSAQVELTTGSVFSIGELVMDGAIVPREDTPVYRAYDTATGSIRSLIFRNTTFWPYGGSAFTRTTPLIRLGGPDVGALSVSNIEGIVMAANIKCIAADGPGNLPKIGIRDCSATGTGTAHLWGDTGGGTAASPVYTNSTYNGTPL